MQVFPWRIVVSSLQQLFKGVLRSALRFIHWTSSAVTYTVYRPGFTAYYLIIVELVTWGNVHSNVVCCFCEEGADWKWASQLYCGTLILDTNVGSSGCFPTDTWLFLSPPVWREVKGTIRVVATFFWHSHFLLPPSVRRLSWLLSNILIFLEDFWSK